MYNINMYKIPHLDMKIEGNAPKNYMLKEIEVYFLFAGLQKFLIVHLFFNVLYIPHVISLRNFSDHRILKSMAHFRMLPLLIHISFTMFIIIHCIPVYFPFIL